jgi:PDZ domain-containing protein
MLLSKDIISIAVLVGLLIAAPLGGPSPYYTVTPGGTYDVASRVHVPEEQRRPAGHLAFTAVYEIPASWLEALRIKLNGQAELVPAEEVRPPGTTQEQINQTNKRLIDESKPVAAVVALRAAGYDVAITGQGVEVESVIAGMPAEGVLRTGDIIVAVDGQPTETTNALIEAIRRHQVGDQLTLTIRRDGQTQDVRVGTKSSPSEPGRPLVGVTISTYLFDVRLPFTVDIESDNVGGPSAGLMFALGILDAVTDGDLTRGYYVAGTGTIGADGSIGPIGGAAEKALAAERDGAQIFLAPKDNVDDAERWVHSIRIVPVERFDDAVRFLCGLDPLPSATSAEPPPVC